MITKRRITVKLLLEKMSEEFNEVNLFDFLFQGKTPEQVKKDRVYSVYKRACKKKGITPVHYSEASA